MPVYSQSPLFLTEQSEKVDNSNNIDTQNEEKNHVLLTIKGSVSLFHLTF